MIQLFRVRRNDSWTLETGAKMLSYDLYLGSRPCRIPTLTWRWKRSFLLLFSGVAAIDLNTGKAPCKATASASSRMGMMWWSGTGPSAMGGVQPSTIRKTWPTDSSCLFTVASGGSMIRIIPRQVGATPLKKVGKRYTPQTNYFQRKAHQITHTRFWNLHLALSSQIYTMPIMSFF